MLIKPRDLRCTAQGALTVSRSVSDATGEERSPTDEAGVATTAVHHRLDADLSSVRFRAGVGLAQNAGRSWSTVALGDAAKDLPLRESREWQLQLHVDADSAQHRSQLTNERRMGRACRQRTATLR